MGQTIDITADDGHRLAAYLAEPAGDCCGGLVVIQTAYGVDKYLQGVCDAYAQDGFLAIAPALYDRQQRNAVFEHTPEGSAASQTVRTGFVWNDVLQDVEAARMRVSHVGSTAIVGFCVGGSVVWLAAHSLPFAAASSYYGKDVVDFLDKPPKCPIQLHFGDKDRLIPLSDVEKIRTRFPDMPTFVYDAGHGFDANNPDAARVARQRTLDLFHISVGG